MTDSRPTLSIFEEISRYLLEITRREATEPVQLVTEVTKNI
jgi:hypothetical protein